MAAWPDKDPNDKLDYTIDWSAALTEGDTIVASEWEIPNELTSSNISFDTTKTIVWLAGGGNGGKHSIINKVTTSAGRVIERSVLLKVKSR